MQTNGLGGVRKEVVPASVQAGEESTKGWSLHENPEVSKEVVLTRESKKGDENKWLGRTKQRGTPCICAGRGGVNEGVVPACKSKTTQQKPKAWEA